MTKTSELVEQWRSMGPCLWAQGAHGWLLENGQPIRFADWQRAIHDAWWQRREDVSTLAISKPKKIGGTTFNAALVAWRWLALPGLHLVAANDLDQSASLVFSMISGMAQRNAYLRRNVRASKTELVFEPTGSILRALPTDAAGNAGAIFGTVSFTEAWGIQFEQSVRSFEELTPIPQRAFGFPCLRVVDSYAGHLDESNVWHNIVDRGLAGERVDDEWPIYLAGGLLLAHFTGEEAQRRCFLGTDAQRITYYAEQASTLRPNTYRRLHLNERTSGESQFIEPEQWDALIDPAYLCPLPGASDVALSVGVDLAVKHDCAAAVSVFQKGGRIFLGPYRIWRPAPSISLDAVESYLFELARQYRVSAIVADPYQAQQLLEHLRKGGLNGAEYPQTTENMTTAGGALFDRIKQRQLVVYPGADDLRTHILNAAAKDTPRGIRLVKQVAERKIDASIALAMAVAVAGSVGYVPDASEISAYAAGRWPDQPTPDQAEGLQPDDEAILSGDDDLAFYVSRSPKPGTAVPLPGRGRLPGF